MKKKALLVAPGNVYQTILRGEYTPLGFSGFNIERLNTKLILKKWETLTLPDQQATRKNIDTFFKKTIVDQPDEMLLYFCGHGDFTRDGGTDEAATKGDEFLILYHEDLERRIGRAAALKFGLPDNELTDIIEEHLKKNIQITLVLDCCHAGGMIDNLEVFSSQTLSFDFFASSTEETLSFARSDTSFFTEALLMASNESRRLGELKEKTEKNLKDLRRTQACVIRLNQTRINQPNFL
jgi:hypothetical protein